MGYFFDVIYITASRTNHYTTEVARGLFLLALPTNCLYRHCAVWSDVSNFWAKEIIFSISIRQLHNE